MLQREKMEEETRQWAQRVEGEKEEDGLTDEVICAVEFGEAAPVSAPSVASLLGRSSSTLSAGSSSQTSKGAAAAAGIHERSSAAGDTAKVTAVGVCIFERTSFKLRFCEIYTTSDLSLLEALLLQVRPACVVSSEGGSSSRTSRDGAAAAAAVSKGWENKLREVAEGTGASYVQLPRRARDTHMLLQDLEGLLRPEDELKNHLAKEMLLSTACSACASLLYYTRLLSDDAYVKQCSLELYPQDLYLQVDAAAAAALYLFPSLALQRRQQQQLAAAGPLLLAAAAASPSTDKDSASAGAYIKRTSAAAAAASSSNSGVSSVYALLARWTGSSLGARRLFAVLSQPLVERQEIERRLDIVEIFHTEDVFRREVFSSHFKHVFDLDALAAKLHRIAAASSLSSEEPEGEEQQQQKGEEEAAAAIRTSSNRSSKRSTLIARTRLGLEGLVRLYNCILEASSLQKALAAYTGIHAKTLQEDYGEPLAAAVAAFKPFLELVDFTIDAAEAARGCFVVKREFDSQLAALLDKRSRVQNCLQSERQRVEQLLPLEGRKRDADAVRLIEDATMGFVFRVTKKDQAAVLSYQHGERTAGASSAAGRLQVLRLNKNEVLFTTAALKQQCSEYREMCEAIEGRQRAVVEKVLCVAASYWPVVEKLAELLGMLDVLGAFAAAANAAPMPYVRPKFIEEGAAAGEERGKRRLAVLEQCRHPLVEQQAGTSAFISNDVLFDREEARVHVVTGPNMGGKSTYIRQVALTVVLAQSGSFVPCSRCEMIVFKRVLCRVGASDMQLRGVSTFYAEMLEAASVLRHAERDSLVIIDEIGRGTSTYEGFGLAWAIAKELAEKSACCCLFATHFHEMGLLAAEVKGVVNSHVAAAFNASSKELTFLYKVEEGAADQSYGVLVAQYAGLPAAVVRRAAAKARELEAVERGGTSKQTSKTAKEEKKEIGKGIKEEEAKEKEEEKQQGKDEKQEKAKEKAKEKEEEPTEEKREGEKGVAVLKEPLQKIEGTVGAALESSTTKAGDKDNDNDGTVSQETVHVVAGEGHSSGTSHTTEKAKEKARRVSVEKEEREFKRRKGEGAESVQGSSETAEHSCRDHHSSDNSNHRSNRGGNTTNQNSGQESTENDCTVKDEKCCTTVAAIIEEALTRDDPSTNSKTTDAERARAWKHMRLLLRDAFSTSDTETCASKVQRSAKALRILGRIVAPERNWFTKPPLRC